MKEQNSKADYVVDAVCPKCRHLNHYDKRVICPGEEHMRTVRENGVVVDKILVKCQHCPQKITIYVDCEGYK